MNESEYYAGEFSDETLDALAEAGKVYLEELEFYVMPTQEEIKKVGANGRSAIID
jgi:hypothetical protein